MEYTEQELISDIHHLINLYDNSNNTETIEIKREDIIGNMSNGSEIILGVNWILKQKTNE